MINAKPNIPLAHCWKCLKVASNLRASSAALLKRYIIATTGTAAPIANARGASQFASPAALGSSIPKYMMAVSGQNANASISPKAIAPNGPPFLMV